MGQPTFDLCYSNDASAGRTVWLEFLMFSLHNSMALAKAIAQAIARSECDAELMRGTPNRLRVGTKQKHLFGLTEITKKVLMPEYIGVLKLTQGTETSKYLEERTSTRLR